MTNTNIFEILTTEANKFSMGMAVNKLADKIYLALCERGWPVFVLNEKYLIVGDRRFQFVRKGGVWTVKEY